MNGEIKASGFWKVNNFGEEYGGDLYVNQSKGVITLELHIPNKGAPLSYLTLPLSIDFITGSTINGAEITLINCRRYKTQSLVGSEEIFGYTAHFLVNGHSFNSIDKIVFSKVSFRLTNLLKWGDISKYEVNFIDGYDFQLLSRFIEPILLFSNDNIKISYIVLRNRLSIGSIMKEELILKQEPYIIIESKVDQPIDFFIEKLLGIKRIIELATGCNSNIVEIKCETSKITKKYGNHIIPSEFDVFHHYSQEGSNSSNRKYEFLFNMNDLINNANLSEWFNKYELLEPVFELYIEDLNNKDLSLNRRFLNLVQALETYHSRIVCNGTLLDYKRRVEEILIDVASVNKLKHEEHLLADCNSKITLKARIYDLLLANFNIFFYTAGISRNQFPKKIADTRNYLTHYDIRKKDRALNGQDLADAYFILKIILEYYIMLELGFNNDFTHDKIKEKEQKFRTSREIRIFDEENNSLQM